MTGNKLLWNIGIVLMLIGIVSTGCSLLGETEAPSEPISAVPLDTSEGGGVDDAASGETDSGQPASGEPASNESESAGLTVFQIVQDESEVRFTLGEVLRGEQTTVVGTSNQVAAEIGVDYANPQATQIGVVQVNARALATDQDRRNRAIDRFILETGDHEFITFTPMEISGLPDSVTLGESFPVTIVGDLTIRDVTNKVTFETTITPVSDTRLEGSASTTINRADYGLQIPSVPFVADVDEEVLLEIDFVAVPAGSG